MLYEPVGYIVQYEVSAILFLIVIMFRYFKVKRFPNQKNKIFSAILWVTVVDMTLDVVSSLIIDNVMKVPVPITYIVNTAFYSFQIILPMLMTIFTFAMSKQISKPAIIGHLPTYFPGVIMLILLIANPLTHWFFYVDPVRGYVHASGFISTYFIFVFYIIATFWIAFRNRKTLRKEEYKTIYHFLIINFIAMVVQYLYPVLLVSGIAMALAVILMYFTIQNPDTMLDTTTGAFTYDAMLIFFRDLVLEKRHVQIFAVNINNMRRINELLGIENGSMLLRQIREYLQRSTGHSWVFRMRGGCFVSVNLTFKDKFLNLQDIEERMSQPWFVGNTEINVKATLCCVDNSNLLDKPLSPEEAANYLDTAFLQNERTGKRLNIITVSSEVLKKIERNRDVERELRKAIETGEGLELYFQPLWSVNEKCFTGAEALLRFHHPTLGEISPCEFVPIAESNGLIMKMDEFVVRKACEFIRDNDSCEKLGIREIEINLSALEFMQSKLPELLNSIILEYRINPEMLIFEITETAATESFELLHECMTKIRKSGCRFALDDFGTGYANITKVIELPFSMVKLDKSLLYGSEIVLHDMAEMFTRMGHLTVIEGVETLKQASFVDSIQANYIQGFYYAHPMSIKDFINFLSTDTITEKVLY